MWGPEPWTRRAWVEPLWFTSPRLEGHIVPAHRPALLCGSEHTQYIGCKEFNTAARMTQGLKGKVRETS